MQCSPNWWHCFCGSTDEVAAEEEVAKAKQEGVEAYAQADVVVALAGWDENSARPAAEGSLRALKYLLEADKELPGQSVGLHLPFEDHTDTGWKSFNKYVQAFCCQENWYFVLYTSTMDSTFWVFLKVSQLTHLCSQSFQAHQWEQAPQWKLVLKVTKFKSIFMFRKWQGFDLF